MDQIYLIADPSQKGQRRNAQESRHYSVRIDEYRENQYAADDSTFHSVRPSDVYIGPLRSDKSETERGRKETGCQYQNRQTVDTPPKFSILYHFFGQRLIQIGKTIPVIYSGSLNVCFMPLPMR